MGTKNDPGPYDGYAKAHPDEPMFTLLGRDPDAPMLVRLWASIRARSGEVPEKIANALTIANEMEAWRDGHVTSPVPAIDYNKCVTCGHDWRAHQDGGGVCTIVVDGPGGICQCERFVRPE